MTAGPLVIATSTAEELLSAVGVSSKAIPRDISCRWVFRGQGDATDGLTPNALRKGTRFPFSLGDRVNWLSMQDFGGGGERLQRVGELSAVDLFVVHANAAGLRLPGDCITAMKRINRLGEVIMLHDLPDDEWRPRVSAQEAAAICSEWPPTDLLSLFALAQHYQMPTRLLDFSWNPYIAAYFAASSAISAKSSEFALWALDVERRTELTPVKKSAGQLRIITVPSEIDTRLVAQQAVFVVWQSNSTTLAELTTSSVDCTPFDGLFTRSDAAGEVHGAPLCKITCRTSEAPKILRLLHGLGIHPATIYGGYSGAASSCREISLWDTPVYPKLIFH